MIATSGPSSTYPQRAYRNPTDALVKFLDYKHGIDWAIWEFRAEGTGYPDSEVYNRIRHYPWPDHHPPPFALIPNIMASMRDWLKDPMAPKGRVIVVHCKAGKGRSGTVACSYLISEEGWSVEDALTRFTARRMRSGFGNGVSIPSQLRWVNYVDWWSKHGKVYVDRQIEILEVYVWDLRDGVKVAVEGYIEEGKIIKTFHTFEKHERNVMDSARNNTADASPSSCNVDEQPLPIHEAKLKPSHSTGSLSNGASTSEPGTNAVVFRPAERVIVPTSDIKIDFERRNKATYGFTMVTSVAHVWFNAYFDSQHPSTSSKNFTKQGSNTTDTLVYKVSPDSGVFEIGWEAMDGIKGSARKGTRAFDRLAVVWRAVIDPKERPSSVITQPAPGEVVPESKPADWTKANHESLATSGKDLGLRVESPSSADISRASSVMDVEDALPKTKDTPPEAGLQSHVPDKIDTTKHSNHTSSPNSKPSLLSPNSGGDAPAVDLGMEKVRSPAQKSGLVQE